MANHKLNLHVEDFQMEWNTLIRKSRQDIKNNLTQTDLDTILDILLQEDVLSFHDMEAITSKPTRTEKIAHLLDIICQRGETACYVLVEGFRNNTSMRHLWKKLEMKKKHFNPTNRGDQNTPINHVIQKTPQQKICLLKITITKWLTEECGIIKQNTSDRNKIIVDQIHEELISILTGKEDSDSNELAFVPQAVLFDIMFKLCHSIVIKAGSKVDSCNNVRDATVALYTLYEVIETFRIMFMKWEQFHSKHNLELPILHQVCKLELERIGTEWFLDLRCKKYINLLKHPSLKTLDLVGCHQNAHIYWGTQLCPKDWKEVDNLLFDAYNDQKTNFKRVLSYTKVSQRILEVYDVNEKYDNDDKISQTTCFSFHCSKHDEYVPVVTTNNSSTMHDYFYLQNNNIISKDKANTNDLIFSKNVKICHKIAIQVLYYLLKIKGVQMSKNRIKAIYLSDLERDASVFDTIEEVLEFLDELYTQISSQIKNEILPHTNSINGYALKKDNACTTQINTLENQFGNRFTCMPIDSVLTIKKQQFPLILEQEMCSARLNNESENIIMDRMLLMLCFMIIRILFLTVDEYFMESLRKAFFYMQFAVIGYLAVCLLFCFIVTNVKLLSAFGIVAYVFNTSIIKAQRLQGSNLNISVLESYKTLSNSYLQVSSTLYAEYSIIYWCCCHVIPILALFAFLYLYTKNLNVSDEQTQISSHSCKEYTYIVMKEQEISRSNWIKISINCPFKTRVFQKLLSNIISGASLFSVFLINIAKSPICGGPVIHKNIQNRHFVIQQVFYLTPLITMLMYFFFFQANNSSIKWSIFVPFCLITVLSTCTVLSLVSQVKSKIMVTDISRLLKILYTILKRCSNVFIYISLLGKLIVPFLSMYILLIFRLADITWKTNLFPFLRSSVSDFPLTLGFSDVDVLPLVIIFFVSKKLQSIHSGQCVFPEEKTRMLFKTLECTLDTPSKDKLSLQLIVYLFHDLITIYLWLIIFIYTPILRAHFSNLQLEHLYMIW